MTRQVVVAVEHELSDSDASAAAAHWAPVDPVDYHLLIATRATDDTPGGLAIIGMRPGDAFGSAALARRMNVQPAGDDDQPDSDLGRIMTRSARRLRLVGRGDVTVTITHGDLLAGVLALVKETGSDEVVIIAAPGSSPQLTMPDWNQKAAAYLQVSQVHVTAHVG